MKSHLESITLEFCDTGRGKYLAPLPATRRGGFLPLLPLRNLRSATPSLLPSFIFLPSSHRGRDPRGDNCRILGRVEVFAPLSPTRARIASKGEDRRGQQGFRSVVDCGDCSPPPPIRLATAFVATWVSVDDGYSPELDRRRGENRCLTIR